MAPCRIVDLLERARKFHRDLADFYARLSHDAERQEVKQLLDYMSRHEEYLDCCLREYEKGASKAVLDTWFKPGPDFSEFTSFEHFRMHPDMTVDEIIDLALRLDQCLMKLYAYLAERAVCRECADALRELLEMEQTEERRVLRAALLS